MSAMNPPCNAELRFMQVVPVKLQGLTDALLTLAKAMDRHSAAIELHNSCNMSKDALTDAAMRMMGRTPYDKGEEPHG